MRYDHHIQIEGFENKTIKLDCRVQVDDSFKAYYRNQLVAEGDQWNRSYAFSLNVHPGEKIVFQCKNSGGKGFIIAEFKYDGKPLYSSPDTIKFIGKHTDKGHVVGNKYLGCFKDEARRRDLPINGGKHMTKDQCMNLAKLYGKTYYGLQGRGECWIGGTYGRYGQASDCEDPLCKETSQDKEKQPGFTWDLIGGENTKIPQSDIEQRVRFGSGDNWTAKDIAPGTDDAICSTDYFGTDPYQGKTKFCYFKKLAKVKPEPVANVDYKCGRDLRNKVFDLSTAPATVVVKREDYVDEMFDEKCKALWVKGEEIYETGTWECHFKIPETDKVLFCPDFEYDEFNPAGCKNALDKNSCENSVMDNYSANRGLCNNKYDWHNFEKFYAVMRKLFFYLKKQYNNDDSVLKNITKRSTIDEIISKIKTTSPRHTGVSEYIKDFLAANREFLVTLKALADNTEYPINNLEVTSDGLIRPDTPMYYKLAGDGIKIIGHKEEDVTGEPVCLNVLSNLFERHYMHMYKLARIIVGVPEVAKECRCLPIEYDNAQKCVPC